MTSARFPLFVFGSLLLTLAPTSPQLLAATRPPPPTSPPPVTALQLPPQFAVSTAAAPWGPRRAKADRPANLEARLVDLVDAQVHAKRLRQKLAGPAVFDNALATMVASGHLRIDADERVQVYVRARRNVERAAAAVRRLGGVVERESSHRRLVQALVPIEQLEALAADGAVIGVQLPNYGWRNVGSKQTAGDAILNADDLRAQFGVDGTGVKVGVISDGVAGLPAAQASGDLGSVDTTTCNVVPGSNPQQPGRAEGTAMLEIVRDIAPGAQLLFGNWNFATDLDFADAITCLDGVADVVVDDIAFFNAGPYDGTSALSANTSAQLNNNANRVRLYATSAGNQAEVHYEESFVDSNVNLTVGPTTYDVHRFQATGSTVNQGFSIACPFVGGVCGNTVFVPAGASITVLMQWNDSFGGSANDYDLFLFNGSNVLLDASTNTQNGNDEPVERVDFTNNGPNTFVQFLIGKPPGEAARKFDIFVLGNGDLNFFTRASSIPNQSDSGGGVITTGAIDAADAGNDTIESFSSRGPTNDGRNKPDITAIDGVQVTGSGGFPSPFFGTSAAAPHVAGIAALLLAVKPSLKHGEPGDNPAADRTALRNAILNTALDLGAVGTDTTFGAGRINALAAAQSLGVTPSTCVPNSTTLCIDSAPGDRRFKIAATFRTTNSGPFSNAQAVSLSPVGINQGGALTFFDVSNPEVLVKVLNGCGLNSRYWVFYAGTTNVQFTITVTDTKTGAVKTYSNPLNTTAQPIQDTNAFATCP